MQEEGDTMKEEFPGSAVRIGEEIWIFIFVSFISEYYDTIL